MQPARRSSSQFLFVCVFCVLCGEIAVTERADAQGAAIIRGEVIQVDGVTRAVGVLVVAVDTAGTEVTRSLSGATGNYSLTVPAPARYVIRALRIGFRPTVIQAIEVSQGEVRRLDISLAGEALQLAAVRVESRASCRIRSDSGRLVARLWEQATAALAASTLASGGRALTTTLGQYRQYTAKGESAIRSESLTVVRDAAGSGFVSVPAETLAVHGYIVTDKSRVTYYSPDANALLSPGFASVHCFTVRPAPPAHAEWIGIGFAPSVQRRVPEITGTLWLDRESAELRRLEFEFVNLPRITGFGDADGWVEFKHLATGDWIISRWAIRHPDTEERTGGPGSARYVVVGARVTGGLTLSVAQDGAVLYSDGGASLRVALRARDSVNSAPGARGAIVGTSHFAIADSTQAMTFTGLVAGRFQVEVTTPFMKWIGAAPQQVGVEVSFDSVRTVSVTLPTLAELGMRKCLSFGALVYGTVSYADGRPAPLAELNLSWDETILLLGLGSTHGTERRSITKRADGLGHWAACVPEGRFLLARVSTLEGDWPLRLLRVPRDGRADLVGPAKAP